VKIVIDVVNFNGDASCLSVSLWLESLKGGIKSALFQWLETYVRYEKKVVLGLIGATLADMVVFNPEAIDFINRNPDTFQLVLRPFSHDIPLLRSPAGFKMNFEFGRRVIETELNNVIPYYLPPEFMLTAEQIRILAKNDILGTFINAERFSEDIRRLLPTEPYTVKGVLGSSLFCLPCEGQLTSAYLESLYRFDASSWNRVLFNHSQNKIFSWRDGESCFLIPGGLQREAHWLKHESTNITRAFLPEQTKNHLPAHHQNHWYASYPVHSFSAWLKEFRMLKYIQRTQEMEKRIDQFSTQELALWLMTINSDILSAVEKKSPRVRLYTQGSKDRFHDHTIRRSERGFEGEDYLALLEKITKDTNADYLAESRSPHMEKLRARINYLERLMG